MKFSIKPIDIHNVVAGRSYKRYVVVLGSAHKTVDEARLAMRRYNKVTTAVLIMLMTFMFSTLACLAIIIAQDKQQDKQNANRGCIASAYQATQNGGDLEANLSVCER